MDTHSTLGICVYPRVGGTLFPRIHLFMLRPSRIPKWSKWESVPWNTKVPVVFNAKMNQHDPTCSIVFFMDFMRLWYSKAPESVVHPVFGHKSTVRNISMECSDPLGKRSQQKNLLEISHFSSSPMGFYGGFIGVLWWFSMGFSGGLPSGVIKHGWKSPDHGGF